jgi:hypothetical protein
VWYYHAVVFIESLAFTRRLQELAKDDAVAVLTSIQSDLLSNPERGRLVPGLAGIRKARASNPARGKGKRGGFRYFYLYFQSARQIGLIYLLDKNESEDLSPEQRVFLRSFAAEMKSEG